MQVREVMTTDVETVHPDEEVSDVLLRMGRAKFNGFPVVDDEPRGGRLVGIVTRQDALQALAARADA
jgi:CBS domain-containing protein